MSAPRTHPDAGRTPPRSPFVAAILDALREDPAAVEELRALLLVAEPAGLLTAAQAAERLSVTTRTVNRMAAEGRLPAVKVGRAWRFPSDRLTAAPTERSPTERSEPPRRPRRSRRTRDVAEAIRGR